MGGTKLRTVVMPAGSVWGRVVTPVWVAVDISVVKAPVSGTKLTTVVVPVGSV